MRKTCRLLIAAVAAVSLAACQDAPVAPTSSADAGSASVARSNVEYENFRTTRPGIFFLQLPCEAGEPGEFLRVSGEWETWGRRPVFESYSSSDGAEHVNVHSKFEGIGIGQDAGHTFAVSLREVDIFNGSHEFPFASGVANWQARFSIVDLTTGERITLAFVAKFVTTPNGDWVVDRIESPPSCNGA